MAKNSAARILCFPSELLDELGRFQGISTEVDRYLPRIVTPPNCQYVNREEAEKDPGYKQIIPYVLFFHEERVFSYRRGKRGSESRLHEKYSIGVGGHIEDDDHTLFSEDAIGYEDAMWREVAEEVRIDDCEDETCVALINDDATDVGRVHFGVVHVIRLSSPVISKNECTITDSGLIPLETAVRDVSKYETWSQLCLANISLLMAGLCPR